MIRGDICGCLARIRRPVMELEACRVEGHRVWRKVGTEAAPFRERRVRRPSCDQACDRLHRQPNERGVEF
jgi:hypothetical protein